MVQDVIENDTVHAFMICCSGDGAVLHISPLRYTIMVTTAGQPNLHTAKFCRIVKIITSQFCHSWIIFP